MQAGQKYASNNVPSWRVLPVPGLTVGELVRTHHAFVIRPSDLEPVESFAAVRPSPPAHLGR